MILINNSVKQLILQIAELMSVEVMNDVATPGHTTGNR